MPGVPDTLTATSSDDFLLATAGAGAGAGAGDEVVETRIGWKKPTMINRINAPAATFAKHARCRFEILARRGPHILRR